MTSATQQQMKNGFLNVQAALSLIKDNRPLRIHHPIGDLLTAMGGEAVHEHRMRRRLGRKRTTVLRCAAIMVEG